MNLLILAPYCWLGEHVLVKRVWNFRLTFDHNILLIWRKNWLWGGFLVCWEDEVGVIGLKVLVKLETRVIGLDGRKLSQSGLAGGELIFCKIIKFQIKIVQIYICL